MTIDSCSSRRIIQDVLDMDLPKHSYTFMKKEVHEDRVDISCVYASDYLKKADDSIKNAVENDLFALHQNSTNYMISLIWIKEKQIWPRMSFFQFYVEGEDERK